MNSDLRGRRSGRAVVVVVVASVEPPAAVSGTAQVLVGAGPSAVGPVGRGGVSGWSLR